MAARRIYLAQHGLAVERTIDPERPLSKEGIAQTRAIAEQLHHADINIARIFHSGKLRALQTAEIFASVLAVDDIGSVKGFAPNDDVAQTISELCFEDSLYIGHLPHLEKLASKLVCGDESCKVCHFKNSAVLCIEDDETDPQLDDFAVRWYLSTELLQARKKPEIS